MIMWFTEAREALQNANTIEACQEALGLCQGTDIEDYDNEVTNQLRVLYEFTFLAEM